MALVVRNSRLARMGASPEFRRTARIVIWGWTAFATAVAGAVTIMASHLPSSTWYVFIGGRSSGPQLLLAPTTALLIAAWIATALLIVLGAIAPFARGTAADLLLVIPLVLVVLVASFAAALLTCAILQLGLPAAMPRSTAEQVLLTRVDGIGTATLPIALATLLGIPVLVARRSPQRRQPALRVAPSPVVLPDFAPVSAPFPVLADFESPWPWSWSSGLPWCLDAPPLPPPVSWLRLFSFAIAVSP